MRHHPLLLWAAALPLLACISYKAEPENGKQLCATGTKKCPDNYVCLADHCWKEGSGPGGSAGGALGGAAGGRISSSSATLPAMECVPSGSTCSKSATAIQFCCSGTACKYTAGTLTYACNGTDCSSAYQSMMTACTPTVPSGGTKVGGAGGGAGVKVAGQSAGALAGSPGGMGGGAGGGARSSSSMAGSMGGVTTVGGLTCQDAGITCERAGTTITACCNALGTDCKFAAGAREFPCNGANCDSAVQALLDFCMGTGGISGSGGSGGGAGTATRTGGIIASGGSVRVGGTTSVVAGAGGTAVTSNTVVFSNGAAVGAMTGYGWVALAPLDTVTSPTCGVEAIPFSATQPCTKAANWNSPNALCVSGIIPALPVSPTEQDYNDNWGIQVGVNAQADPASTLGRSYSTISASVSGAPAGRFRISLHRQGDPDATTYCYDASASGQTILFTRFNTKCWGDVTTVYLVSSDVPNIDRVSIQINSASTTITLANMCLTNITFGN